MRAARRDFRSDPIPLWTRRGGWEHLRSQHPTGFPQRRSPRRTTRGRRGMRSAGAAGGEVRSAERGSASRLPVSGCQAVIIVSVTIAEAVAN